MDMIFPIIFVFVFMASIFQKYNKYRPIIILLLRDRRGKVIWRVRCLNAYGSLSIEPLWKLVLHVGVELIVAMAVEMLYNIYRMKQYNISLHNSIE